MVPVRTVHCFFLLLIYPASVVFLNLSLTLISLWTVTFIVCFCPLLPAVTNSPVIIGPGSWRLTRGKLKSWKKSCICPRIWFLTYWSAIKEERLKYAYFCCCDTFIYKSNNSLYAWFSVLIWCPSKAWGPRGTFAWKSHLVHERAEFWCDSCQHWR